MPKHQIRTFIQGNKCCECNRSVKPWGRSICNTCGRIACQSHRDYARFWECKNCKNAKSNFEKNLLQPQENKQPVTQANAQNFMTRLAKIENIMKSDPIRGQEEINNLYKEIMED